MILVLPVGVCQRFLNWKDYLVIILNGLPMKEGNRDFGLVGQGHMLDMYLRCFYLLLEVAIVIMILMDAIIKVATSLQLFKVKNIFLI